MVGAGARPDPGALLPSAGRGETPAGSLHTILQLSLIQRTVPILGHSLPSASTDLSLSPLSLFSHSFAAADVPETGRNTGTHVPTGCYVERTLVL